jgi:hypothetical protein
MKDDIALRDLGETKIIKKIEAIILEKTGKE